MEFQKKFGQRKRSNPKRGIFLIILLIITLVLWLYAEDIMESLF